ncbi:molybdenum cofactor guanylyltransferase [Calidifontibacillus oryziterrae]|uniref:molybdenum cofactor guanylyltransferase n=1 Tax=Calidifontibacillus oryziterrae TaxID=1191699 RepID=UPI00030528D9|nr:molybdenum cofactor guanylyltransferase [Calidifontibacillus oryziterrae]
MKASGIILAGGQSSRMGKNKALLDIDGKTNIERIKDRLQTVFPEVLLVANHIEQYEFLKIPIVQDVYPGKGPLAGIHSGLKASSHDINFFVACDMPFISAELARYFVSVSEGYDAVVPKINGKIHPLFSVFHKSVLPLIESRLIEDRLVIKNLLDDLNVRVLDEKDLTQDKFPHNLERVFYNMNYPSDYENVKKWALSSDY